MCLTKIPSCYILIYDFVCVLVFVFFKKKIGCDKQLKFCELLWLTQELYKWFHYNFFYSSMVNFLLSVLNLVWRFSLYSGPQIEGAQQTCWVSKDWGWYSHFHHFSELVMDEPDLLHCPDLGMPRFTSTTRNFPAMGAGSGLKTTNIS